MRAFPFPIALVLTVLLALMLLPGDAAGGWRHHGHGYGYGGYGSCGYGYGGYGYYGGGYGYYGGGYWGDYARYSPAPNYPMYSWRAYSSGATEASYSDMRPGAGLSYGAQPDNRRPYGAARTASRPTTVVEVAAFDNYFQASSVTVQPGTTVRWTNRGTHAHTVTSNQNLFDSGDMQAGATYSATFRHPGSYYYYCRHHTGEEMRGVIVVQSASAPTAARAPTVPAAETARRPGAASPARSY